MSVFGARVVLTPVGGLADGGRSNVATMREFLESLTVPSDYGTLDKQVDGWEFSNEFWRRDGQSRERNDLTFGPYGRGRLFWDPRLVTSTLYPGVQWMQSDEPMSTYSGSDSLGLYEFKCIVRDIQMPPAEHRVFVVKFVGPESPELDIVQKIARVKTDRICASVLWRAGDAVPVAGGAVAMERATGDMNALKGKLSDHDAALAARAIFVECYTLWRSTRGLMQTDIKPANFLYFKKGPAFTVCMSDYESLVQRGQAVRRSTLSTNEQTQATWQRAAFQIWQCACMFRDPPYENTMTSTHDEYVRSIPAGWFKDLVNALATLPRDDVSLIQSAFETYMPTKLNSGKRKK